MTWHCWCLYLRKLYGRVRHLLHVQSTLQSILTNSFTFAFKLSFAFARSNFWCFVVVYTNNGNRKTKKKATLRVHLSVNLASLDFPSFPISLRLFKVLRTCKSLFNAIYVYTVELKITGGYVCDVNYESYIHIFTATGTVNLT